MTLKCAESSPHALIANVICAIIYCIHRKRDPPKNTYFTSCKACEWNQCIHFYSYRKWAQNKKRWNNNLKCMTQLNYDHSPLNMLQIWKFIQFEFYYSTVGCQTMLNDELHSSNNTRKKERFHVKTYKNMIDDDEICFDIRHTYTHRNRLLAGFWLWFLFLLLLLPFPSFCQHSCVVHITHGNEGNAHSIAEKLLQIAS